MITYIKNTQAKEVVKYFIFKLWSAITKIKPNRQIYRLKCLYLKMSKSKFKPYRQKKKKYNKNSDETEEKKKQTNC